MTDLDRASLGTAIEMIESSKPTKNYGELLKRLRIEFEIKCTIKDLEAFYNSKEESYDFSYEDEYDYKYEDLDVRLIYKNCGL